MFKESLFNRDTFKGLSRKDICCLVDFYKHKEDNENHVEEKGLKFVLKKIQEELYLSVIEKYSLFLIATDNIFEICCAEILLELKELFPNIRIYCFSYKKMPIVFKTKNERERYKRVLEFADRVIYYDKVELTNSDQNKIMYMINSSSKVVLFNDGSLQSKKALEYIKSFKINAVIVNKNMKDRYIKTVL